MGWDADTILSIPLPTRRQPDFYAWHHDRKGLFSVCSAYRMMINIKITRESYFDGVQGSSNAESEANGWSSLWMTAVPSKIKNFLWRLA
jgi:hypothetical protein